MAPRFVVQRHDATRLHFDVRLEIDGTLASWAVPKGPSLDPRDKRLAVRVGDHELSHADFEGRTPDTGGPGTVIVWDTGTWANLSVDRQGRERSPQEALTAGHLTFALHGERLTGEFALLHSRLGGDDRNWLLVKADDDSADRGPQPTSTQPGSVLSGRTNADLESD